MRSLHLLAIAAVALGTATAQDLLGVTWTGQVVLVDSQTAAVTPLGTGLPGQNALGRDGTGAFWSTTRTSATPYVYGYTRIDPATGAATTAFTNTIDLRGLCEDGAGNLFAIAQASSDQLVRLDIATGTHTVIGNTGFGGLQGLALHQGVLYGWDISAGLLVIDQTTGVATDPFPSLSGPTGLQYLCSHPDGRLLVGGGSGNTLYTLDVTTGLTAVIGSTAGASDLRGLEALGGYATRFGQGCNGPTGPVTLTVTGSFTSTGSLLASSGNHAPGTLGAMLFGISTVSHLGIPLPYLLDPAFGTAGCNLYVSIDATLFTFTTPNAPATLDFPITFGPGSAGAELHVQHACFDPVPGGMSWSNGVTIRISP